MSTPTASKPMPKGEAIKEINEWLDYKKVRPKKRETNEDSIEELVDAIECGDLIFDKDTKELKLQLAVPLGTNEQIKELTFKARISVGEVHPYLKKIKTGDGDGRLLAYVKALTNETDILIESMDTGDQSLATCIVVFFL